MNFVRVGMIYYERKITSNVYSIILPGLKQELQPYIVCLSFEYIDRDGQLIYAALFFQLTQNFADMIRRNSQHYYLCYA